MKRDKLLRVLAQAREQRARKAGDATIEARSQLKQHRQHLDDLVAWHTDYRRRGPSAHGDMPVSAAQLEQWRMFLAGIESAISHQRDTVALSEHRLESAVATWRHETTHTRIVNKLRDHVQAEARGSAARADQEVNDAAAQRCMDPED